MVSAYRGNGTLAVDGTKPELRNGATWCISSVGSPLLVWNSTEEIARMRSA